MAQYRPGQLADLLGVSADTVRRWCDEGRLETVRTEGGHRLVEGAELARFVREDDEAYAPEQLQVPAAQVSPRAPQSSTLQHSVPLTHRPLHSCCPAGQAQVQRFDAGDLHGIGARPRPGGTLDKGKLIRQIFARRG